MFTQPVKKVWGVRDTSARLFLRRDPPTSSCVGNCMWNFWIIESPNVFFLCQLCFFSPQVTGNVDGSVLTAQSQCHICTVPVRMQLAVFYW